MKSRRTYINRLIFVKSWHHASKGLGGHSLLTLNTRLFTYFLLTFSLSAKVQKILPLTAINSYFPIPRNLALSFYILYGKQELLTKSANFFSFSEWSREPLHQIWWNIYRVCEAYKILVGTFIRVFQKFYFGVIYA